MEDDQCGYYIQIFDLRQSLWFITFKIVGNYCLHIFSIRVLTTRPEEKYRQKICHIILVGLLFENL